MPPSAGPPSPRSPWPLRGAALACVAGALLVPTVRIGRKVSAPLRLFDVSASIPERARSVSPEAGEHVLVADGVRVVVPGERSTELARDRTRLGEALLAAGALREGGPAVLWLTSDGRDTEGGAAVAAAALAARGHRLYVTAPDPAPVDVGLVTARVVTASRLGPVTIRVRAEANVSGRARLVLRRDGEVRATTEETFAPGVPLDVDLVDAAGVTGPTLFEVLLAPLDGTPDDDPHDDRVALPLTGEARLVLVIDADAWPPLPAPAPVEVRAADVVDPALGAAADLLVVSDVPWRRLGAEGTARLRRHLASGGTVLFLGGPDAYGLGGWRDTDLEALSPLRPRRAEDRKTALVLAIDHSGSTGEAPAGGREAIAALRRAGAALLDLAPADLTLAVLPFTDRAAALLAPGFSAPGDDEGRARLREGLGALAPSGGTDVVGAIVEAVRRLSALPPATRRRILLLTDGDPDHPLSPASLAPARAALSAAGVELSAVVRGDPAAVEALRSLAARPDDVVRIEDADAFPEALLATFARGEGRDELASGPVALAGDGSPDAQACVGLRVARLHRLDAAPDATVFARATFQDGTPPVPFGASRRVGAGRVIALATGPALEAPTARTVARGALAPLLSLLAGEADRGLGLELDGDRATLAATAGRGLVTLALAGGEEVASLLERSPGLYVGRFPAAFPEEEALFVRGIGDAPRPVRVAARPPVEHRGVGVDDAALEALALAGGGRRLAPGEAPPSLTEASRIPLAPPLLLLAVALVLLERARGAPRRLGRSPS